jgi:hypothetical protein
MDTDGRRVTVVSDGGGDDIDARRSRVDVQQVDGKLVNNILQGFSTGSHGCE